METGLIDTPLMPLMFTFKAGRIYRLQWMDASATTSDLLSSPPVELSALIGAIMAYFTSSTPLLFTKWSALFHLTGTPFQRRVWEQVIRIPYGDRCSYQAIAHQLGQPTAVRAVANAIGANPYHLVIPCHRVIRSDGSLGGYRGGGELKAQLLAHEESG